MFRAHRSTRLALTAPRALGALLIIASVALAGCEMFAAERAISAAAARQGLQSALGGSLVETPPIETGPTLTDVERTYTMKTKNERLLVLVFNSRDATVQFTGAAKHPRADVVVVRNVVAVYEHRPGTKSRIAEVRAVLRRLDRATA